MAYNAADSVTPKLAADVQALGDLRRSAAQDPAKALKATAQQFETLFMNMLMKSMRDAMPKDDMLSSSATETYTGMLDQQFAQKMASRGTGIADMIVKQLGRQMNAKSPADAAASAQTKATAINNAGSGSKGQIVRFENPGALSAQVNKITAGVAVSKAAAAPALSDAAPAVSSASASSASKGFLQKMWDFAVQAEQATGLPAKFMIGQAALETGWGKREISHADGSPAYNLFGIKAGSNWNGATVDVTTTEYVNGVARKVVEKFRAYASYAESFRDYASMMVNSPRYSAVVKNAGNSVEGFAGGLQRAGYATDPRYAEKLTKTINNLLAFKRGDKLA